LPTLSLPSPSRFCFVGTLVEADRGAHVAVLGLEKSVSPDRLAAAVGDPMAASGKSSYQG
jgi:hypothetical protein